MPAPAPKETSAAAPDPAVVEDVRAYTRLYIRSYDRNQDGVVRASEAPFSPVLF